MDCGCFSMNERKNNRKINFENVDVNSQRNVYFVQFLLYREFFTLQCSQLGIYVNKHIFKINKENI